MRQYPQRNVLVIAVATCLFVGAMRCAAAHTIEVTDRTLFGPGPFPDQKLKTAWIRNLTFDSFLNGIVKGKNNLGEPPNVSGEELQGKIVDGKLSDDTLINEDIDMSNAVIMNGQFNLLLAAVYGGPNSGDTHFYLDDDYNWWIKDDIAIDPGFPAGIVKINDFTFTTGPRIIPSSIQTEAGYPGGTNQTGSLAAGRVALGQLGDKDLDGYLDGMFNAIGRFPMESIFLPGAPFVQLFEFRSDIPITALDAALLTAASVRQYAALASDLKNTSPKHQDIGAISEEINQGIVKIQALVEHARRNRECASCTNIDSLTEILGSIKNSSNQQEKIDRIFSLLMELHRNNKA